MYKNFLALKINDDKVFLILIHSFSFCCWTQNLSYLINQPEIVVF